MFERFVQKLLTEGIGHKEFRYCKRLDALIPREWAVVSIYDIKANVKGAIVSGPFGSNIGKRFFVEEGIPVIRGNNLTLGEKLFIEEGFVFVTEEKAEELKSCTALPQDLVFTAAGTVGQVGLIPDNCRFPKYIISNKQLRARIDRNQAYPLFLFYWFSSPMIKKIINRRKRGTSIPVINLSVLKSLPVLLPPLSEQKRIAKILTTVDEKLRLDRKKREKMKRVKGGLMDDFLTGKRRVKVAM